MPAPSFAAQFSGIVGWSADDSLGYGLTSEHTTSESGLYVTNLNELLSLEVLSHLPPEGETLAQWLSRITPDVVTKVVNRVLAAQQAVPSKDLLVGTPLLNGLNRLTDTVSKQGRFVGFALTLPARKGVRTVLHRVSVHLSAPQSAEDGPLQVYVYRSTQEEPLQVIECNPSRLPEWVSAEVDLSEVDRGETILIGYYENDLTGFAVGRNWSFGPCGCTNDPYPLYQSNATVKSVSFPAASLYTDRYTPDVYSMQTENNSFGLNIELSVSCGAAGVLALPQNRLVLAEVLQLALACRVLEGIVGTTEITQKLSRDDVQADAMALLNTYQAKLEGGKDPGTDKFYKSLYSQVALDTAGLDSVCLPKVKSWVSVGTLVR